jgi:hypothetical protein
MNSDVIPVPPLMPEGVPAQEMQANASVSWLRRLLVCNPFYLASAALLLFGLSRLTRDPRFLTTETREVLFQFGVLQAYGFLLVGTALWLARRRIWYDSALLVVLENGLLLAPFLGISQAVLLDETLAVSLALGGGLAVVGRAWSIRRGYAGFNLSDRARLAGALILAINVGLPLIYKTRVDTDWHAGNRILWLAVLPLLALLPNLFPAPTPGSRRGPATPAEASWLPMLIHGLWLAGTAVHAWSIAWVDKTPTPNILLLPVAIASLWTVQWRHQDFMEGANVGFRAGLLVVTAFAGWMFSELPEVAVGVAAANLLLFVLFSIREGGRMPLLRYIAWGAAAVSAFRLLFLLRPEWVQLLLQPKPYVIALGVVAGVVFVALLVRLRTPVAGIIGALGCGLAVSWFSAWEQPHLGIQVGALVGLAHSLRWVPASGFEARLGQCVIGLTWTIDSLTWAWEPGVATAWMPCAFGGVALAALAVLRARTDWPVPWLLIGIAGLNFLVPPGTWTAQNLSVGVLTLLLSLACFAVGTAFAVRRQDSRP